MVYVINKDGKPLMPTKRHGKVRRMLKEGKAEVVRREPFTIRLLTATGETVQEVHVGVDTGFSKSNAYIKDAEGCCIKQPSKSYKQFPLSQTRKMCSNCNWVMMQKENVRNSSPTYRLRRPPMGDSLRVMLNQIAHSVIR